MQRAGGGERLAGRPDGLVCLLGVLDLAVVLPWRRMDVLLAIELTGLVPGGVDRRLRQRGRVGAHISDVAVLVEPLGDAHGPLRAEPELATGLLLQRRGHERRVRAPGVRLLLHRRDRQRGTAQTGRQRPGPRLVEHEHLIGLADHPERVEVASSGHPLAVDGDQPGVEPGRAGTGIGHAGVQLGQHVPVGGAAEGHPLPLPLHDDAGRDRLHPAGREPRSDLLPQHRTDLVAVETVQDAPGLLRIDQIGVQIAGMIGGGADSRLGDLVEDHPAHRDGGFQGLEQMPGDRLALAVTVGGEIELVDSFEQALEFGDGALLFGTDDIEGLEVGVDVDTEARPGLGLILGRHVGRRPGQVPDVASGGLHDVVRPQVAGNFAGFGRRLDDDKTPYAAGVAVSACAVVVSQVPLFSTSESRPTGAPHCAGIPQFGTHGPADANRLPEAGRSDPRPHRRRLGSIGGLPDILR